MGHTHAALVSHSPLLVAVVVAGASLDGDEAAQDYLAYTRVVAACDRFAPLVTRAAKQICKDRKYRLFTYKQGATDLCVLACFTVRLL